MMRTSLHPNATLVLYVTWNFPRCTFFSTMLTDVLNDTDKVQFLCSVSVIKPVNTG
jgi:hypothetical protein